VSTPKPSIEVQPLLSADEASQCAQMMATAEPWITLTISYELALNLVTDPSKELVAARDDKGVTGFIVVDMRGTFRGYIQTLCVRADCRGQGIGSG
jgi:ribosomal protein S18 acetylase RimI-like enzyme